VLKQFCKIVDIGSAVVADHEIAKPALAPWLRLLFSGYRYVYDGNGERVEKCQAATATTACPTSGTNGKLYWKGTGSDPLAESDLAGNAQEEYIFFNGTRIARRDVSSTGATIALHYYFSDHLGTHAVVENAAGTQCEQDIDYYPYGGQQSDYCTTPVSQNYKFTGKERDGESGLDNFGARYDTSNLGRFMTPDWAAKPKTVPYANFGNPQSLNLYSYVENNPTTFGDPDGHGPSCNDYPGLCAAIRDAVSGGKSLGDGVASYLSTQATINTKPPKPPGTPKWTYKQSSGSMDLKAGTITVQHAGTGYAGHGEGLNDPESQSVGEADDKANAGPLPRGEYSIGKQRDNTIHGGRVVLRASMRLTPNPSNVMEGRDGFLIHGDNAARNQSASEGCAVLGPVERNTVGQSGINTLEVEQ
jgi:RHS repeat-associated protein